VDAYRKPLSRRVQLNFTSRFALYRRPRSIALIGGAMISLSFYEPDRDEESEGRPYYRRERRAVRTRAMRALLTH